MKITFVSPGMAGFYRVPPQVGGAEVQLDLIARHIAKRHEIQVVSAGAEGPAPQPPPGILLRTVPSPRGMAGGPLYFIGTVRAILGSRPDVVVQRVLGLETLAALLAARLRRVPFVFHWSSTSDRNGPNDRQSLLWPLYAWARRRADHQVCNVQAMKDDLPARERRRTTLVPDPIDRSIPWRTATGSEVLWVGRLAPAAKHPERFLDLARRLPHRRFLLVGPLVGPPAFQAEMRDAIWACSNLEWTDGVGRERLPSLYARARCLVNTSDYEAFPTTFLEAFASGVPVVSLHVNPEGILRSGGPGLCAEGDTKALSAAVEAMFEEAGAQVARAACPVALAGREPDEVAAAHERVLSALFGSR